LIRQLLTDGYYPKAHNTSPLVDFEEYEVAQNHKSFWSLKTQPTTYALLDGESPVGTIGADGVSVPGAEFDCFLHNPYVHRSGHIFQHLALRRPGQKVPFFFTDLFPLAEYEQIIGGLTFLTTFEQARIWTNYSSFFIADELGAMLGQFLAASRVATSYPGAKGTIHVRTELEAGSKAELLAVLFAVSTMYSRGLLDTTGF
jgi:hypothetical protein